MRNHLFVLAGVLAPAAVGAQVAGRVVDSVGAPVADARVQLVELGRARVTGADGRFHFTAVAPGRYTLSVARVGHAPQARRVAVPGEPLPDVVLRAVGVQLAAVQVTASPGATRADESPQPTAVVEGAELRTRQGAALAEAIELVPGVRSLSMTTGIGKPVIRGMTHYRVVTLDNGQRSETQAWGHDHSPNVETAAAERVEVIKGPASVLYGSDALGGVVNVIAPPVPDALDGTAFVRGRATTGYHTNVRGGDGTLSAEGARGGVRARGALTLRRSGAMRTPAGALDNTDARRLAAEGALGWRGTRGSVSARYAGRDERLEIFDDPAASPGYTGYQRIATHRASIDADLPLGGALAGARLQANAGYEQNLRREFAGADAAAPDLGLFVRNWTGFAHLHHAPVGPFAGTLGVSAMESRFANRGSKLLIPGSVSRTGAVYLFEQAEVGRWRASLGARFDHRTLSTDGEAGIGVPAQRRAFPALTGSAGVLYRLSTPVALVANVARGFRAPAAPDLWANGFHEGTRAFERGAPDLRVETSLNTELGARVTASSLTAELTGFVNRVDDYIYLRPFGAGGGTFDSLQVVQGDARLVGVEGRAAWRALPAVTLQLSGDWVRGQNLSADVPLTFIPPLRVVYGLRLDRAAPWRGLRALHAAASAETHARQTRLDPRDLGPPGYTLTTVGGGFTRLTPRGPVTVDLSVRNLFDVRHRSFMSRYKAFADGPGRGIVLRVGAPL
ncbi:TonB-dependent receptor [Roseisolibacter sp. H3M3-2]|uniref:TonB-dependent receptor n=1 Tax=Roseisolibacter sp. H3M3-2 TaxID=3031323 RepID=UPI0023D9FDF5|nr:TonB-dependent receptor [Roseisolibacter sp. H3M3-2]MDF1503791.1 TonB-dependent receptor [Roseisolibacter sp. H3M3-2]